MLARLINKDRVLIFEVKMHHKLTCHNNHNGRIFGNSTLKLQLLARNIILSFLDL